MSNFGTRLLFAEAKIRLDEILRLAAEYNGIADTLIQLGYVNPDHNLAAPGSPWPVPTISICGNNCCDIEDSEILDEFIERGPMSRNARPLPRIAMGRERQRLGIETGWKCFYCGGIGDQERGPDQRIWHVDHAYPLVRGGDDQPDNHVLACATCNLEKKARSAMEYFALKR